MFGKSFRRGKGNGVNAALSYGYALLRDMTARALAVHGFLLCNGIRCHSELKPMNLADDFMEPFRPVVDFYVVQNVSENEILTPKSKHALFYPLACDILSGGQRHSVHYAIERLAQSLTAAIEFPRNAKLVLPALPPLKFHRYE